MAIKTASNNPYPLTKPKWDFKFRCPRINIERLAIGFTAACVLLVTIINMHNRNVGSRFYRNKPNSDRISVDLIPVPHNKSNRKSDWPIILYYNSYFKKQYYHFVPTEKTKISCPYKCVHTTDRKRYGATAKVRIFHERNFNSADLPPNNPQALNVYYTLEPPYLTYSVYNEKLITPDYFNVTASYRTSSEIYFPYDYFIERDGSETADQIWTDKQVDAKVKEKRNPVLVAMSNCKPESNRLEYVHAMEKFVNITKLGICEGKIKCSLDDGKKARRKDIDCMQKLITEHYFFLSFENSVCPEYVTEKFWRVKNLVVPIVLSRAVMPEHIPDNSYIAASDFESPEALTNYLKYLINNPKEYKKYFQWTKIYRKSRISEEEIAVSCQLCKLAHQNKSYKIENYKEYWSNTECVKNYALNLLDNQPNNINNVADYEQRLSDIMKATYRTRSIGKIL